MLEFIGGIIFIIVIFPILDNLSATLVTGLGVLKVYWRVKIAKLNQQIQNLNEENSPASVIGFVTPIEGERD